MSIVTLNRSTKMSRLRSLKILINGVVVKKIGHGKSVDIPVEPGQHSLSVKIDWVKSNDLQIDVKNDETIKVSIKDREGGIKKYIFLIGAMGVFVGLGQVMGGGIGGAIGAGIAAAIFGTVYGKPVLSLENREPNSPA